MHFEPQTLVFYNQKNYLNLNKAVGGSDRGKPGGDNLIRNKIIDTYTSKNSTGVNVFNLLPEM